MVHGRSVSTTFSKRHMVDTSLGRRFQVPLALACPEAYLQHLFSWASWDYSWELVADPSVVLRKSPEQELQEPQ